MLTAALQQTVPMGWIRPEEIRWVARLSDRMSARAYAKRLGGKPAAEALREYQQTMTEWGFLHNRAVNQTPPRDINERMGALLQHAAAVRPYVILPPPSYGAVYGPPPLGGPRRALPLVEWPGRVGRVPPRRSADQRGAAGRPGRGVPGAAGGVRRRHRGAVATDHGRPWAAGSRRGRADAVEDRGGSAGTGAAGRQPGAGGGDHHLSGRRLRRGLRRLRLVAGLSPIQVHVGAASSLCPCWCGTWCGIAGARSPADRPRPAPAAANRRVRRRHRGGVRRAGGSRSAGLGSSRRIASGLTGSRPPPSRPPSGCWTGCRCARRQPRTGGRRGPSRSLTSTRVPSVQRGWTAPAAGTPTASGRVCGCRPHAGWRDWPRRAASW